MRILAPGEYPKDWDSSWLWCGKISVHLGYPSYGSVSLSLLTTAFNGSLVVHLSEVFDPFWEMLDWLKAIADDQLPASFTVDEEGQYKEFVVSRYAGDGSEFDIEFRVNEGSENDLKGDEGVPCYFITRARRKQFLEVFSCRLESWLANDYDSTSWLGADPDEPSWDLRNLDVEGLKRKIQGI